jgi:hypothetical protein
MELLLCGLGIGRGESRGAGVNMFGGGAGGSRDCRISEAESHHRCYECRCRVGYMARDGGRTRRNWSIGSVCHPVCGNGRGTQSMEPGEGTTRTREQRGVSCCLRSGLEAGVHPVGRAGLEVLACIVGAAGIVFGERVKEDAMCAAGIFAAVSGGWVFGLIDGYDVMSEAGLGGLALAGEFFLDFAILRALSHNSQPLHSTRTRYQAINHMDTPTLTLPTIILTLTVILMATHTITTITTIMPLLPPQRRSS